MAVHHRSIHPRIAGVPWWAAVLIAVASTAVGFAVDAGSATKELTNVFDVLYALGCLAAVLAVRQSGLFTAVVQPPLILFAAVPGAYFVFQGAKFTGLKNLALNCGYPLIERFPLMLATSAGVLLIGLVRWYLGTTGRSTAKQADASAGAAGRMSAFTAKLASVRRLISPESDDQTPAAAPRRRRTTDRPRRTADRAGRPAKRADANRSRYGRPAPADTAEPVAERPRRRRPDRTRDHEVDPDAAPRRRPSRDRHGQPVRKARRDPHRASSRDTRFDPYERDEYRDPPPRRRRPVPNGTNGNDTTHHPISRVRYRGAPTGEELRTEPPTRSPRPRRPEPDSWNYDI